MIKPMVFGSCSIGLRCNFGELEQDFRTLAQLQESKMLPRLEIL